MVVVPAGPDTVVRRRLPALPKPPQELQKASEIRNAIPPTIIKITPMVWRLKPFAVTDTANHMMAPTAKITRPVPTPIFLSLLLQVVATGDFLSPVVVRLDSVVGRHYRSRCL